MIYKIKDCIEDIVDNRGRNPKYYDFEKHPVIDNVAIKNNFYVDLNDVNRYIDQETFDNFLRDYVEKDMPVMTLVGNGIANVALIKDADTAIVQNTIGFKTKKFLNSIYLYYWFLFNRETLLNLNRGSGQPSIRKTDIENLKIDVPDLLVQNKIVDILTSFDKKIKLNKTLTNILDETALCYFNKFQGEENFDFVSIFEVSKIKYGRGLRKSDMGDDGYPVYGANGIIGHYNNYMYEDPQILISCRGVAGDIHISKPKSFVTSNSLIMELFDYRYFEFYKRYFSSCNFCNYATGSAQPQITIDNLKNAKVPYIEYEKIMGLSKTLQIISKLQLNLYDESNLLKNLQDAILPKLMSGEIEI